MLLNNILIYIIFLLFLSACIKPLALDRIGFRLIRRDYYPAFLMNDPTGSYNMIWLKDPCVNCASLHGSTNKPDFWPY